MVSLIFGIIVPVAVVLAALYALYFVIKWAVANGIKQAYRDIKEESGGKDNKDYL